MRLKLLLVGFGIVLLLLMGFRPDGMPYPNSQARYSDSMTAHWPNALYLRTAVLDDHEFPVWRETTMAGQPFAANPLNKTAYPLQWLALLFSPTLFLNLMIILHLAIAGGGMWLWAKSLGLRVEAVAFSAAAYAFAPEIIGRIGAGHFDILYALAWWPWLMWAVKKSCDDNEDRLLCILQVGILTALVFLGDTRTGLFALVTAAIYEIYCLAQNHRLRYATWHVWILPVFLILTAALLIPLKLWQPYVTRDALTLQDAGISSLDPVQFLGLILPALQNIEQQTYLGLPILALAVLGVLAMPRRKQILWLIAVLLITLYALGLNGLLWPLLVKLLPVLLWFRIPSRIWVILALVAAPLAGYGLQWLLNALERQQPIASAKRLNLLVVIVTFVAILFDLFGLVALHLQSAGAAIVSLALGIVLAMALNGRLKAPRTFRLLFALLLIDLAVSGIQLAQWRGPDFWLEPYQPVAERLAAEHPDRIYSPTYSIEQQVAEIYHLHLFGGVDPFQLSGIVDAVSQGSGIPTTEYSPVVPPLNDIKDEKDVAQANPNAIINTQILAHWDVSHVVSGHALDNPRLQQVDVVNGVYMYKNLDYVPRITASTVPDWPADWAGLPDDSTVQSFNQTTILAVAVSGVGWVIAVIALVVLILLKHRSSSAKG